MRLLIDVGNTELTLGLVTGTDVVRRARLTTRSNRTPDEWGVALDPFVAGHGDIASACLASVAPMVTASMVEAVAARITGSVAVLTPRSKVPIVLDVDEPHAVGADRIANALAVLESHPGDSIVVDLGTATTFDCVTADRRFIGGSIMPGLRTSADQLIARGAQLTATELQPPKRAIGRTTAEHIQGGVLFGTADSIDGMVRRLLKEWPNDSDVSVVATGGLAQLIAPLTETVNSVAPDLTLHGLRIAADALELPA